MKNKLCFFWVLFLLAFPDLAAQQPTRTVGVLSHAGEDRVQDGYNLFYPHNQADVWLLDNCGRVVHSWQDDGPFVPGNTAYILPNGNLVKAKRAFASGPNNPIWAGGGGETIELLSWDNELLASTTINNDSLRFHHDIAPLPNGIVLAIVWEAFDYEEAVSAGRDTTLLPDGEVWAEAVFEIDLLNDTIVWEWHAWDHLVQDFDASRANYGAVETNPQLINLNYVMEDGSADWLHINAIDYNPRLDQIILSVPHFDEVWIIDHSTTTAEAATSSGGLSGRGGDLMYRWGNPATYNLGNENDQTLYFQHDIAWIDDFIEANNGNFGQLSVFNNRVPFGRSTVNIFDPGFDTVSWSYPYANGRFLPAEFTLTADHPEGGERIFSSGLSGMQLMPNGNLLITSGRLGYTYELNPATNEVVWEFSNPIIGGERIEQGTDISTLNRLYFRMPRYPKNYVAFQGRDLTPGEYLELNPDEELCASISSISNWLPEEVRPLIYPNPVNGTLHLQWPENSQGRVTIHDLFGRTVWTGSVSSRTNQIATENWASGLYIVRQNGLTAGRVLISR